MPETKIIEKARKNKLMGDLFFETKNDIVINCEWGNEELKTRGLDEKLEIYSILRAFADNLEMIIKQADNQNISHLLNINDNPKTLEIIIKINKKLLKRKAIRDELETLVNVKYREDYNAGYVYWERRDAMIDGQLERVYKDFLRTWKMRVTHDYQETGEICHTLLPKFYFWAIYEEKCKWLRDYVHDLMNDRQIVEINYELYIDTSSFFRYVSDEIAIQLAFAQFYKLAKKHDSTTP